MAFVCQRQPYLKEFVSKVTSCIKVNNGYEVILNDTVFFPEGGGQPDDRGKLGECNVLQVLRRGSQAVHIIDSEIKEGEDVKCTIDWKRRYDHMQQHSAQHLLSAILDSKFGYETISWDLGRNVSHVELNTPKVTSEQLKEVELECNIKIRNKNDVIVHYLTKAEAEDLEEVKTRGLPDDVVEPVRVIEIKGVEKNMCCGTHVENLCDLQMIKILHTEPMRGGTRVFFLAGNRLLDKLSISYDVERKLTKLLSCGIDDHCEAVDKMKANLRVALKANKSYLKELAVFQAQQSVDNGKDVKYIFHHREDGDMDYIFSFVNSLPAVAKDWLVFVCVGATKSGGQFILRGPEHVLNAISKSVVDIIGGKGGGKKGQLQGKASSFKNLKEIEALLKETVQ